MRVPVTPSTPLAALLAERVPAHGPVTFAEFMEFCLYHPEHGYYTKTSQEPRRDYCTSVDASPLFGRLLARQFQQMWVQLGAPQEFLLIEAGAGTGALAAQVLDFLAIAFPDFYLALRYYAVERSPARRAFLYGALQIHIDAKHLAVSPELPAQISNGCIFSNEFFDAMPVHRVIREENELRELYVGYGSGGLQEQAGPLSSPALSDYFSEQKLALRDGQQAEVNLQACDWIAEAAKRLQQGFVLTIDYGHEASQLYNQRHMRGTLLAYRQHRASEEFLRVPGEQDLTAHVNFTALEIWGKRGGLQRTGFTSQSKFLMSIARASDFADMQSEDMSEAEQSRARLRFKTLIYPEGMGETFQVLIQHKNVRSPKLCGLDPL
ncbi:MAG: SAM-dependent methyltransferase [Candidatus Acidiferrales bacterium]